MFLLFPIPRGETATLGSLVPSEKKKTKVIL